MQGLAFANVLPRFVSRVNVLKRCACRLSGEGERLDLRAPLKTYFGLANFREGQEQVIEKLVNGKSAVAVFPTAGGKSLCYQLPAVMFDGLTVVVSPLLSLMRNQVDYLSGKQIPAAMVSSAQSPAEVDEIYEKLRNNEIKLLYCSPERFYDDRFLSALKKVQISMFAVDEAHCISEWGHSFRPLYTRVATMANMVGAERCLALTATATLPVISDIRNDFGIAAEDTVSLPFHRPNLQLKVSVIPGFSERLEYLYQVISERPRGSVIVYVMLQSTAEQVAQYLQERGIDAEFYHAGMNGQAREVLESRFQNDLHVIVATIAFGMGIDKADVRYVYHFNVAKSIEAYSQETGRAGRDGLPSICETFFDPDDVQRAKELINTNLEANRELEHSLEEILDNGTAQPGNVVAMPNDYRLKVGQELLAYAFKKEGFADEQAPVYKEYSINVPSGTEDSLLDLSDTTRRILQHSRKWRKTIKVERDVSLENGFTDGQIIDGIQEIQERSPFDVKPRGRIRRFLPKKPFTAKEATSSTLTVMKNRNAQDHERIDHLARIFLSNECVPKQIAAHFATEMESCGQCTACMGGMH